MQNILEKLKEKARLSPKRIAFPEYNDERVMTAVDIIRKEGLAQPIVVSPENMEEEKQKEFARLLYKTYPARYKNIQEVEEILKDPLYYAAMLTRTERADGFIAGAAHSTSSVARAAIKCLQIDERFRLISSVFVMVVPDSFYGEDGVMVYADCAIIPSPSSEQLATIAIYASDFTRKVLGFEPRVAFLSFSSKGSASLRWVEKIREAFKIVKEKAPQLLIDGELQADAALDPEVARRKSLSGPVVGRANVLIFPDLNAGNISYKLVQRLAKARAIGPVLLGLHQPCSDLSRGCSIEDIVDVTALTVVRAQIRQKELE